MVNLTIDNKAISVPAGTTIMEAAEANGIRIPRLCYLKEINEIGACRVCVVEMEGKEKLIPSDGVIYATRKVTFYEGESVFDVLLRETKNNRVHMEYSFNPLFNSNYIEAINNLYEFDCGQNSGWMYNVNGWYPNYGCSRYIVQEGDEIQWNYTCDLGRDLGTSWMDQNGER